MRSLVRLSLMIAVGSGALFSGGCGAGVSTGGVYVGVAVPGPYVGYPGAYPGYMGPPPVVYYDEDYALNAVSEPGGQLARFESRVGAVSNCQAELGKREECPPGDGMDAKSDAAIGVPAAAVKGSPERRPDR